MAERFNHRRGAKSRYRNLEMGSLAVPGGTLNTAAFGLVTFITASPSDYYRDGHQRATNISLPRRRSCPRGCWQHAPWRPFSPSAHGVKWGLSIGSDKSTIRVLKTLPTCRCSINLRAAPGMNWTAMDNHLASFVSLSLFRFVCRHPNSRCVDARVIAPAHGVLLAEGYVDGRPISFQPLPRASASSIRLRAAASAAAIPSDDIGISSQLISWGIRPSALLSGVDERF